MSKNTRIEEEEVEEDDDDDDDDDGEEEEAEEEKGHCVKHRETASRRIDTGDDRRRGVDSHLCMPHGPHE